MTSVLGTAAPSSRALPPASTAEFLLDAHVHLHSDVKPEDLLDAAATNLRRLASRNIDDLDRTALCLALTETHGAHRYTELAQRVGERVGEWRIESTGEDFSLRLCGPHGVAVVLLAGRQLATREGLELHALGISPEMAAQLPCDGTVDAALRDVIACGATPVLPWGFGKWTLRRSARIVRLLQSHVDRLYVSDSALRPRGRSCGKHLALARRLGIPVLAGTDPLPLPGEFQRAGTYACWLAGDAGEQPPGAAIKSLLAHRSQPRIVGVRCGRIAAWSRALQMQIAKRRRGRVSNPVT